MSYRSHDGPSAVPATSSTWLRSIVPGMVVVAAGGEPFVALGVIGEDVWRYLERDGRASLSITRPDGSRAYCSVPRDPESPNYDWITTLLNLIERNANGVPVTVPASMRNEKGHIVIG